VKELPVLFGASAGRTDARRRDAGDAGCIVEERQHSRYAPFTAAPLRVRPAGPPALCSLPAAGMLVARASPAGLGASSKVLRLFRYRP